MGQSTTCTAVHKRHRSAGRADLETDYVLFRGDFRVKLPLSTITAASARDGVLSLTTADGTLTLALGPAAAKWAQLIAAPKSRLDKIGIKPGHRVSVLGVDDGAVIAELKAAGADVSTRARKHSDAIFFGVETGRDLERFAALAGSIRPEGAVWAIRRKGQAAASEAATMAAGKAAGLVDVKVVRFSETHTAEKFVIPTAKR